MINFNRKNINLAELRRNVSFNQLIDAIRTELDTVRAEYEDAPASEFNRGRVSMLKELLSELTRNATGNNR